MRVLIVDDNEDTRETIAAILRFEDYDVITAADGHAALKIAKVQPPDIALLDLGLPGMDGFELARLLRQQLAGRALYIAALTGYGTAADKECTAAAGFDAHLTKPTHPFTIIQLLEDFESRLQR
jgi:CheY-like chemotaxis protein